MQQVTIKRLVFDWEEETEPKLVARATCYTPPKYDGSVTRKNRFAYVTFSNNETERYDVSRYPDWRTVEVGDLVETDGHTYYPLHRKPDEKE